MAGDLIAVTAYVTLEPCAFQQRTPSCARELVVRRIGTVHVALIDPHPKNQGRGVQLLRRAGIRVISDLLADEARLDLGPYLLGGNGSPTP